MTYSPGPFSLMLALRRGPLRKRKSASTKDLSWSGGEDLKKKEGGGVDFSMETKCFVIIDAYVRVSNVACHLCYVTFMTGFSSHPK